MARSDRPYGSARCLPTLAACALVLASCSASKSTAEMVDGHTGCTSDYQCPTGYSCDVASRTCLQNDSVEVDLVLQVRPFDEASGSGYLASQYVEIAGRLDTLDTDLVLASTSTIGGLVSRTGGAYVEARLDLAPQVDSFPDTLRKTQSVTSVINDVPGLDNYATRVVAGVYSVSVSPRGSDADSLPPLYPGDVVVEQGTDLSFDVTFPASFRTMSGTLRLSNSDPVPHSLKIWAVDVDSGRRVSTIASTGQPVTGSDCAGAWDTGQFCLVLSPSIDRLKLKVAPGENSAQAAAYPTITLDELDVEALDADGDTVIDLDADMTGGVHLPVLGDLVVYRARVEGLTSAGLTQPVEGVSVSFTALRDGASFDVYSITNSEGEICQANADGDLVWGVMLRENVYQVTIIPPMGQQFESQVLDALTITYTGDGILMGQVYQLSTKKPFVGQVRKRFTGEPLQGLIVEAYPINSIDTGDPIHPFPRYNDGLTGVDGLLRLDLDRGIYDVLIRSTLADGVPWMWLQNKQPDNEEADLEVLAPEPVALTGTLSTADLGPASQALVSVYQVVYSPDPDEPPATRLVWDTTATDAGTFTVLLSP